jgi:hypothetical protein
MDLTVKEEMRVNVFMAVVVLAVGVIAERVEVKMDVNEFMSVPVCVKLYVIDTN